jgi:hypothetical protein
MAPDSRLPHLKTERDATGALLSLKGLAKLLSEVVICHLEKTTTLPEVFTTPIGMSRN